MSTQISILNTGSVSPLFVQTSTSPNITGTSAQSLISTGIGSLLLPANTLVVGSTYRFTIEGSLENPHIPPDGFKIEIGFLGSSPAALTGASGLQYIFGSIATGASYKLETTFTVYQTGTAGVAEIASSSLLTIGFSNTAFSLNQLSISAVNTTTFSTLVDNTLDIQASYTAVNANNRINSRTFVFEKVK